MLKRVRCVEWLKTQAGAGVEQADQPASTRSLISSRRAGGPVASCS